MVGVECPPTHPPTHPPTQCTQRDAIPPPIHPTHPPNPPTHPLCREMTQGTFEANDFFGWFAGKFEWGTTWLLTANEEGLVTKEAVRSVYDGSLFYKMEVG